MNPPTTPRSILLENARIVRPDGVPNNARLIISGGHIVKLLPQSADSALPDTQKKIDLSGLTLLPGFIDVHIHGAVGVDVMDASSSDLIRVSTFLSSNGVTGWLPTLVPATNADYSRTIKAIAGAMKIQARRNSEPAGARILGVHYEGPFINTAQCGALHAEHFKAYSQPSDLASLKTPKGEKVIKMITLAPEIEGGIKLIRELRKQGCVVSIGHTRADVDMLDLAFSAGARHMTHFMNAMTPLHHRTPGPVGWGLSRDDVTCDVIADGVHLDPRILGLILKMKTPRRLMLISDAIAATGMGDGKYKIWGETITVEDGRTRNARGSIAGSVITMHGAFAAMRALGASKSDAAAMTATNPAQLLSLASECGSIEEGKRADLVALDENGKVRLTIVGGAVVHSEL